MSEKIEKPMSETTIQEKLDKEKRPREASPEAGHPLETSKRRELDFPPETTEANGEQNKAEGNAKVSSFSTAKGFGGLQENKNALDLEVSDTAKRNPSPLIDAQESIEPNVTPSNGAQSSSAKQGFNTASGFGSFANNSAFSNSTGGGGFSSLLSSSNQASGFSSLLDAEPKNSSFTDKKTISTNDGDRDAVNEEEDTEDTHAPEAIDEQQYVAVKGLEKTTVVTGEEGEDCIYSIRAKLYAIDPRNADSGWKERGIGNLRVLEDELKRTRLVMRADAVLRVILNMPLHQQYKLEDGGESMGDKTIRLFGIEDGMGTWLALRVSNSRAAQEMKGVIQRCMEAAPIKAHEVVTGQPVEEAALLSEETQEKHDPTGESVLDKEPVDSVEATELRNEAAIEKEKADLEESTPAKS